MHILRKIYDNLEEGLSAFLVGVMILCLIIQGGIRTLTGSALAWTEELSRFCFIWAVYVAASLAVKRAAHVRISAQFLLAPLKARLFFRVLADAAWLGFNIFFVALSSEIVADAFAFPEVSPTLGWTKAYIELIIPVSFVIMSWRLVETYLICWKKGDFASLVVIAEEGQKK